MVNTTLSKKIDINETNQTKLGDAPIMSSSVTSKPVKIVSPEEYEKLKEKYPVIAYLEDVRLDF